jgi:hypothetical protein
MTIEVRQILIKASVTKRLGEDAQYAKSRSDHQAQKEDILEACRKLILEVLKEEKER